MKLTIDGEELPQDEFRVVLGCTIAELGLGFKPTPRAYEKPGHFHLIAGTVQPIGLVPHVHEIYMGKDITHKNVQCNGPVSELILEPLEEKLRWMIDGEVYDTDETLKFSVGPTITMVAP